MEIEAELKRFDGSLSPFNDTATITRINRNEEIIPDTFFTNVFRRSMEISRETQGAFDITIAPLANAWGFGFKKGAFPDSAMIDSLLDITGYPKVSLSADGKVIKQDSRIMLSCSADVGIATSGNYRNYYYKDGKKYAHTIDPRTGYPVQHSILSATVIARDCMSADAYATAFMVMGLEEAERFADSHPDLDACFIYADEKGELRMFYTKGMDKYMTVK